MVEKTDLLSLYNDELINELNKLNEDNPFTQFLLSEIGAGNNTVVSKILQESKIFDVTWIDTLESYFPSLDKIIRNPKSSIKNVHEVIASERAKKITSESIRHLAAHSEYIKEVDTKTDTVTPSKVLTTFREQDMGIYENRFIKTLVNRLYAFIIKRYELVKDNYQSFTRNILEFNSNYNVNDSEVKCKIQLDVKSSRGNERLNHKNKLLVEKIEKLSQQISAYKYSPFMVALEGEKEVLPPIMKTNIILRNPDFRNCYLLWLFMDRYTSLGYDVSAREKQLTVEEQYRDQLLNLAMITYISNQANNPKHDFEFDEDGFKEKILKRLRQRNSGELQITLKPENIQLENTLITEHFLKEANKMFNDSYEELLNNGDSPTVALKKVIREMLEVVNHVYKSLFDIPAANDDIFQRLLQDQKSDEEFIKEYKQKIKVYKDVVSVKESDLKKTKQELAKMERMLEKHQNAIARAKAREQEKIRKAEEKARLAAERAKQREEEKARLAEERAKAREEAARLKVLEKERLAAERAAAKEAEKARLAEERAQAKEAERLRKEAQKAEQKRIEREKALAEKARLKAIEKAKKDKLKEKERLAKKKAAEKAKAKALAEKAKEQAKLEREKALAEQKAKEAEAKAEQKRLEKERLAAERKAAKEAEKARLAEERRLEKERLAAEEAERKRLEQEEAERRAAEEAERIRLEKEEAERKAAEEAARQERLRIRRENDLLLQQLVKQTKDLAKETEDVAQQTMDVLLDIDEDYDISNMHIKNEPVQKVIEEPKEENDLMKLVQETKEIAEHTTNIAEQVEDIVDDVRD